MMKRKNELNLVIGAIDFTSGDIAMLGIDDDLIGNIKLAVNMLDKSDGFKGVRSISLNDMFNVAWLKPDVFEILGDSNLSLIYDMSIYPMPQIPDDELIRIVNKYKVDGEIQTCDLTIDTSNKFTFYSDVVDMESHIISTYRTQPIDAFHLIEAWDKAQKENLELSCVS